jgi:hypothetical protein
MAIFEFKLPDLGEGVQEGELVKWHVKAGDAIKEDQTLAEVMTDKATVTVPSPKAGRVVQTHAKEGEMAKGLPPPTALPPPPPPSPRPWPPREMVRRPPPRCWPRRSPAAWRASTG